jgi:hypothetical protein
MFEQILTFIGSIWADFLKQTPANQLAIVAGVISITLVPIGGWLWSALKLGKAKKIFDGLEAQVGQLREENKRLMSERDAEIVFANHWVPARWLEAAKRERKAGNHEKASQALRVGFENVRVDLSTVALELARNAVAKPEWQDYEESERFARIATLLDANGDASAGLLVEILTQKDEFEAADANQLAGLVAPDDSVGAKAFVQRAIDLIKRAADGASHREARKLSRVAMNVARRAGIAETELGLELRFQDAHADWVGGFSAIGLEKVQALLPVLEVMRGSEHPQVLVTRQLEVWLLNDRGMVEEALEKVRALLEIMERVQGAEQLHILSVRHLEAQLLYEAGRANEALQKLQVVLATETRLRGAEHRSVLTSRHLEAQLLNETGKTGEALRRVGPLLLALVRVHGEEHPHVLAARHLEAQLLNATGEAGKALEAMQALLPVRERVEGDEHPEVLRSQWLLARILAGTKDTGRSRQILERILPLQVEKSGAGHRYVRETRELLAELGKA